MSLSVQAARTEYHRLCGLSNKHVFLIILGTGKSKIKALAEPVSGESALPDL